MADEKTTPEATEDIELTPELEKLLETSTFDWPEKDDEEYKDALSFIDQLQRGEVPEPPAGESGHEDAQAGESDDTGSEPVADSADLFDFQKAYEQERQRSTQLQQQLTQAAVIAGQAQANATTAQPGVEERIPDAEEDLEGFIQAAIQRAVMPLHEKLNTTYDALNGVMLDDQVRRSQDGARSQFDDFDEVVSAVLPEIQSNERLQVALREMPDPASYVYYYAKGRAAQDSGNDYERGQQDAAKNLGAALSKKIQRPRLAGKGQSNSSAQVDFESMDAWAFQDHWDTLDDATRAAVLRGDQKLTI